MEYRSSCTSEGNRLQARVGMVVHLQAGVRIRGKTYGVSEIRGIRSVEGRKIRHLPGDAASSSWETHFRAKAWKGMGHGKNEAGLSGGVMTHSTGVVSKALNLSCRCWWRQVDTCGQVSQGQL